MRRICGLATDVHAGYPGAGTLVIRTPYGRSSPAVRAWGGRGPTVMAQDVRGRYDSPGTWMPYADEGSDGAATLAQAVRHDIAHGPFFPAGSSYEAHAALEGELAARNAGMSIAGVLAIVPALGLWETAHDPDGTPRWRDRIGWWHQHGFSSTPRAPLAPGTLDQLALRARTHGPLSVFSGAEYDADARAAWRRLWTAPPVDPARYGGPRAAPLLLVTGHHDFFRAETVELARNLTDTGRSVDVIDGPWGHGLMADLPAETERGRSIRRDGGLLAHVFGWIRARIEHEAPRGTYTELTTRGPRVRPLSTALSTIHLPIQENA
ncbi:CocE/NonD family hydrolase [Zhihengliuella halotolerans]|uniref:X-Pro dipeptidyl-peptidase-like protein n=1 Tax=Zhihengliuella halotolerans TaxID=370736 RepID=A0A4Q8AI78_9MICC|nr:CocE/NonD family hydrolase [Zhihengliuella halotolerans]RZU63429.1 X-Pro dipeptidyl-peptidase-like protein [Zhihengliuella halotolerans]